MRLTYSFSRVSAFGVEEDDDDGSNRDPEVEEEFLSRDWPEASQPLRGGKLKWKEPDEWMGNLGWSRAGGGGDSGPRWMAQATDQITYEILATRKLNAAEDYRDRITDDFCSYEFDTYVVMTIKKNKRSKPERKVTQIGWEETLAEAQKVCEEHNRDQGWE